MYGIGLEFELDAAGFPVVVGVKPDGSCRGTVSHFFSIFSFEFLRTLMLDDPRLTSAIYAQDIKKGDRLVGVDTTRILSTMKPQDISKLIQGPLGRKVTIILERSSKHHSSMQTMRVARNVILCL